MTTPALKPRLTWWGLSLLAAIGFAAGLLAVLGPDGLPKEGKQTATPWYGFLGIGAMGALMIFLGGHGGATRRVVSLADDSEFGGDIFETLGSLAAFVDGKRGES